MLLDHLLNRHHVGLHRFLLLAKFNALLGQAVVVRLELLHRAHHLLPYRVAFELLDLLLQSLVVIKRLAQLRVGLLKLAQGIKLSLVLERKLRLVAGEALLQLLHLPVAHFVHHVLGLHRLDDVGGVNAHYRQLLGELIVLLLHLLSLLEALLKQALHFLVALALHDCGARSELLLKRLLVLLQLLDRRLEHCDFTSGVFVHHRSILDLLRALRKLQCAHSLLAILASRRYVRNDAGLRVAAQRVLEQKGQL